jgi:hypothetical protein
MLAEIAGLRILLAPITAAVSMGQRNTRPKSTCGGPNRYESFVER